MDVRWMCDLEASLPAGETLMVGRSLPVVSFPIACTTLGRRFISAVDRDSRAVTPSGRRWFPGVQ